MKEFSRKGAKEPSKLPRILFASLRLCGKLLAIMKMQRILVLMCAAALLVSSVYGQRNTEWKVYIVNGEELSVALPSPPTVDSRKTSDRQEWTLKSAADGVEYTIYVIDNPEPRKSLAAFIEEQNAWRKWNLSSERDLAIGDFISKVYSPAGDAKGVIQFIRTGERLYYFRALGAPADDPRVTKFFSSIALVRNEVSADPAAPPGSTEKIFKGKEVDRKARLTHIVEPSYTKDARANKISGIVILKAVFSSTGKVTNIRVVTGLPYGLTEQAIEAAKKIKFTPAMKDGKPVSMWMQLEYNFIP